MKRSIFLVTVAVLFAGSAFGQNTKLQSLTWLLGKWHTESVNSISEEIWYAVSPYTFEGKGMTISKSTGDTVFVEKLWIIDTGGELFYIAKVAENEYPVSFKLSALTQQTVLFENPEHDYPQKISYSLAEGGKLFTTVIGNRSGKEGKLELQYNKVEKPIE